MVNMFWPFKIRYLHFVFWKWTWLQHFWLPKETLSSSDTQKSCETALNNQQNKIINELVGALAQLLRSLFDARLRLTRCDFDRATWTTFSFIQIHALVFINDAGFRVCHYIIFFFFLFTQFQRRSFCFLVAQSIWIDFFFFIQTLICCNYVVICVFFFFVPAYHINCLNL